MLFKKIFILILMSSIMNAGSSPMAEKHISTMLTKQIPYQVTILDTTIQITDSSVYPPGKLTEMFATYLLEHGNIKNAVVADVGAGAFALGIIMARHGAHTVVGVDISPNSVTCAQENIKINNVQNNASIICGQGTEPLRECFSGKIDILLSGAPWDSISVSNFSDIPEERKLLSRAFYDVEDQLISAIFTNGFDLLAPGGKIFITACLKIRPRIEQLCLKHSVQYQIVAAQDLHNDGNTHYILKIEKK